MATRNPFELPPAGRLLGVDSGSTRVGLAVSDTPRRTAVAIGSHPRKPWSSLKDVVIQWKTQGVTAVVVGLPLNMDGSEGPSCNAARSLADVIEKECALPVLLWDERLTSQQAEAAFFQQRTQGRGGQRQTRASKAASVGHVDAPAATLMLQGALNALHSPTPPQA